MSVNPPQIMVDELTFVMAVGFSGFLGLLWLLWLFIKLTRDMELKLRLQRKNWIYSFFHTHAGSFRKLLIPEDKLGSDQGFNIEDERYYAKDKDEKGNMTVSVHRGKRAYIHSEGKSMPEAFVSHSLDSVWSPKAMHDIAEGNMAEELARMKPPNTSTAITLVLLVVALFGIFAVAYLVNQQTSAIDALHKLLTPAPSTPTNPGGVPG